MKSKCNGLLSMLKAMYSLEKYKYDKNNQYLDDSIREADTSYGYFNELRNNIGQMYTITLKSLLYEIRIESGEQYENMSVQISDDIDTFKKISEIAICKLYGQLIKSTGDFATIMKQLKNC